MADLRNLCAQYFSSDIDELPIQFGVFKPNTPPDARIDPVYPPKQTRLPEAGTGALGG
jgi:hypothetical protein